MRMGSSVGGTSIRPWLKAITLAVIFATAAGCMTPSPPKDAEKVPPDQVGRPKLAASEAQSLQTSIMALADTSIQRIGAATDLDRPNATPEERRDSVRARMVLSSALISIAMQPDPVDALADIVTHTTLTADAQRAAAKGEAADSSDAKLLVALEQNEADAWKLAERWVNAPTRVAFRKRILAWPGVRTSAADVAFVRLSDLNRGGVKSVDAGEGMFDTLRAATQQVDQTRLLAERSLFLAQRLPFLMRWHAEVYTGNTLATREAQQTTAQLERLTRTVSTMTDEVTRERQAALEDLFSRVAAERKSSLGDAALAVQHERKASLEQVALILQQERTATLNEASAAISAQREAVVKDILLIKEAAERTASAWIVWALLLGLVLIGVLLGGALGTALLYHRLTSRTRGSAN